MSIARSLTMAAALAVAPSALAQGSSAQAPATQPLQMVPRPTPDADALADAMRRLGANPRELPALIEAGELSLRLGDVTAAAALFKRAEMVDPMNGRVKAGMARILVTQERPGEALRYFDQATGYGLDPSTFAGDRALAYDLIGEQERAQRDYRVALKQGRSDEVERRYALSLGIAGKRDEALAEIDAQVRRNDRSAWRTRAFILAMTGDVPGAEKIAATMMPSGMGGALAPFFGRLAALTPIDRAFAVHFGELRASPQRLADARMAPPLPALTPEAAAPVQLATAEPLPSSSVEPRSGRQPSRDDRRKQRALAREEQRAKRERRTEAPPVALASASTDPSAELQPPRYGGGVTFAPKKAVVQALPAPIPASPPVRVAAISNPPPFPARLLPAPASTRVAGTLVADPPPDASIPSAMVSPATAAAPPATSVARGGALMPQPLSSSGISPSALTGVTPVSDPRASSETAASAAATPGSPTPPVAIAAASSTRVDTIPASPSVAVGLGKSTPTSSAAAPEASPPGSPVAPAANEDTILARIMAGISIPAAELGVAPVRSQPVAPAPGTTDATPESIASAETARRAADVERAAQRMRASDVATKRAELVVKSAPPAASEAQKAEGAKSGPIAGKARSTKSDLTKRDAVDADKTPAVDPKKAAAERKAEAAKKLADAKKAAEAKKAADEAKLAKADPARIWVQVAGGANEADLPKAWNSAKAKAVALKGRDAYSTPLRATNRVVTGPFKTDAEARAFVNTLAKQGVSAFPFTSAKGQKMKKLSDQ